LLNIAEIELFALSRQCLDRRISDLDTLKRTHASNSATYTPRVSRDDLLVSRDFGVFT
jgi:hypothetical protein